MLPIRSVSNRSGEIDALNDQTVFYALLGTTFHRLADLPSSQLIHKQQAGPCDSSPLT